jgi:hypothetical protein
MTPQCGNALNMILFLGMLAAVATHAAQIDLRDYHVVTAEFGILEEGAFPIPSGSSAKSARTLYDFLGFTSGESEGQVETLFAGIHALKSIYGLHCRNTPPLCRVVVLVKGAAPKTDNGAKPRHFAFRGNVARKVFDAIPADSAVPGTGARCLANLCCEESPRRTWSCNLTDVSIPLTVPLTELIYDFSERELRAAVRLLRP